MKIWQKAQTINTVSAHTQSRPSCFTSTATLGFTIVEMMIAIAIIAVIAALALPSLSQFFARNDLIGSTNELITGISQARAEAISRSSTVTLCPSSDGAGCDNGDWESGWIVFADNNANGALNAGEDIVADSSGAGTASVDIAGFDAGLSFNGTGILSTAVGGNIVLSHPSLPISRQLTVSNLGQVESIEIHP